MLTNRMATRIRQWGLRVVCSRVLLSIVVLSGFCGVVQAGVKLMGFNMVQQENVMLHFDLDSASAIADVFSLSDPDRLVIDLPDATLATPMPNETFSQGVVSRIRYAQHGTDYLRVVSATYRKRQLRVCTSPGRTAPVDRSWCERLPAACQPGTAGSHADATTRRGSRH